MAIREEINKWTHGEDWRTWVAHSVLAVGLSAVFGKKVAIGFYFLRECDQVLYRIVDREPLHPVDHFMDVAVPAAVVLTLDCLLD